MARPPPPAGAAPPKAAPLAHPLPPPVVWAEGPNFTIRIEGAGVAVLEVRRNAALTRSQGAAAADEMAAHLSRLVGTQRGLVLDLRLATSTWGPQTDAALVQMLAPWEARGLPIRVVPADEPIQAIAVKSLIARAAPRYGALADTLAAALAMLAQRPR